MRKAEGSSKQIVVSLSAAVRAEKWLRRYAIRDSLAQALEGGLFMFLGLIIFAFTSYLTAFALFFGLIETLAFFSLFGLGFHHMHRAILGFFGFLLMLVSGLSFVGAYRNKYGMDYSNVKVGLFQRVSGDLFAGAATLTCDGLFSGPRLLFGAGEALLKAFRLLRMDFHELADIIVWLLNKGTKATAVEIAHAFPEYNIVRLLPELRDLTGVIWLANPDKVVILLSPEFKKGLSGAVLMPRRKMLKKMSLRRRKMMLTREDKRQREIFLPGTQHFNFQHSHPFKM